jgi:putative ABC transport system ATP-binding protein
MSSPDTSSEVVTKFNPSAIDTADDARNSNNRDAQDREVRIGASSTPLGTPEGALTQASLSREVIKVANITKRVTTTDGVLTIVNNADFTVNAGEAVAVIGASGSGKSTLLGLMAGLDTPTEGDVFINGESLFTLNEDGRAKLRGRLVGFVFQSFQLLPSLTALENVMLPLELAGVKDAESRANAILTRVGLAARVKHYPRQLSGGEQQRVAIARAFVTEPKLLFADEPTGNLDGKTGRTMVDLLFALNRERGTTLILVTHDLSLAERCDRRLTIDEGVVTEAAAA